MAIPASILVLRHEPFEHLGYFADILADRGIPFIYKDLGEALTLGGKAGLIVMGGPQSANDPEPALAAERQLISQAIDAGLPVLGVCLGAQLIAKTLGARVYANGAEEIGWAPVFFTAAARADPVFCGLPSPTTFFHWHGETFDLPPGAEWLAYSKLCRQQAFRYGTNVYGIQFHPEITPEMIADWSTHLGNCGGADSPIGPIDPRAADTAPLARQMIEGWLATF